jgi:hypothetical protein
MRYGRTALAVLAILACALTGCTRAIAGVAQPDPRQPGIARSEDGFGITAGFADAPVQIEFFTEPQCDHCAHVQAEYGEQIKSYLESGQLAVTYRPVTFFDEAYSTDYSAVVSNALFLAIDSSADSPTTAGTFQTFVEELWANQDLSFGDYLDSDFADIASASGLSDAVVENIAAAKSAIDAEKMNASNTQALTAATSGTVGTPLLYDLKQKAVIDLEDPDWLDNLFKAV